MRRTICRFVVCVDVADAAHFRNIQTFDFSQRQEHDFPTMRSSTLKTMTVSDPT